jgi:VWFA-related protein
MLRAVCIAALALVPVAAFAQNGGPDGDANPTLHITTRLVYVDVIARDSSGKVLKGLTLADFKVFEDGKSQAIEFFDPHRAEPALTKAEAVPPQSAATVFSNDVPGGAASPITIVLFDLLNTPHDDQLDARQRMLKFLNALPPGNHMIVVTLTNSLQMTQGISGSPELVTTAEKMLRPRDLGAYDPRTETQMESMVADNASQQFGPHFGNTAAQNSLRLNVNQGYDIRAHGAIDSLLKLAKAMDGYPGRKSLYWLSEAFPLSINVVGSPMSNDPASGDEAQFNKEIVLNQSHFSQSSRQEMQSTLNALASARIAVYPTYIVGLPTEASSPAVGSAMVNGTNPNDPRGGFFALNNLKTEMNDLARTTGGEAIFGKNDIAEVMQRTMDDGATYYTIAYKPSNNEWKGQFRAIRIEEGSGAALAYRRGYFATPDASATRSGEDFQRAMQPGVPEETALRLRSQMQPSDPQNPGQRFISTVNATDVDFVTTTDGHHHAKLFVQLIAYSDAAEQPKMLPQSSGTLNIDLDPQKYEYILSNGIAFPLQLSLKPGRYRLMLGVNDENSHKPGTLEMSLTVPAS